MKTDFNFVLQTKREIMQRCLFERKALKMIL